MMNTNTNINTTNINTTNTNTNTTNINLDDLTNIECSDIYDHIEKGNITPIVENIIDDDHYDFIEYKGYNFLVFDGFWFTYNPKVKMIDLWSLAEGFYTK